MKSTKLVGDDLSELDRLLVGVEEEVEELDFDETSEIPKLDEIPTLIPRTPQPRKRKVSIFDLVKALEKALEVKTTKRDGRPLHPRYFSYSRPLMAC